MDASSMTREGFFAPVDSGEINQLPFLFVLLLFCWKRSTVKLSLSVVRRISMVYCLKSKTETKETNRTTRESPLPLSLPQKNRI